MKKIINIAILLCIILPVFSQNMGINTVNPQALLHLDGASTVATTNPQTGAPTAIQMADDIIISTHGRMSFGAGLTPSHTLHIVTAGVNQGLRIVDTSQGIMKVLVSDQSGIGSWAPSIGLWSASLMGGPDYDANQVIGNRLMAGYSRQMITSTTDGAVDRTAGTITVPYTGIYRVYMNSWFNNTFYTGAYKAGLELRVNNSSRWTPSSLGSGPSYGCNPTFISVERFNAGDVLTVYLLRPSVDHANRLSGATIIVEFIQPL